MKRKYWFILLFLTLVSIGVELLMPHYEHWWNKIPAFFVFFGFIGCILIILVSKALGKLFIQKNGEYYND